MKISLDGGITWLDSTKGEFSGEVRIQYDLIPEELEDRDLYITATEEGLIMDAYANSGEYLEEDTCVGTSSQTAEELYEGLGGDLGPTIRDEEKVV